MLNNKMTHICAETHLFCTHLFLQLSKSGGALLCWVRFVICEAGGAVDTYPTETDILSGDGTHRWNQLYRLVWHLRKPLLEHTLKQEELSEIEKKMSLKNH